MTLPKFTKKEKWLILLITILGALIRLYFHFDRDLLGDEIGTLKWIEKDIPYLLSHFQVWLTMNYFIILEKVIFFLFQENRSSLMLIPMMAGIITIPFTAVLAKKLIGSVGSIIAAILAALSPYLIIYSGIIRAYSLMILFALIVIIVFFNWLDKRNIKNGMILSLFSYLLVITHPNGIYVICCIVIFAIYDITKHRFNILVIKEYLTIAIPMFMAIVLIFFSYIKIIPEMLQEGKSWHVKPPSSVNYISELINTYFAEGFLGWISLFLVLFGFYKAMSGGNKIIQLIPFILTPIILLSAQGVDHYPWAYARMLIFTLPLYLIFLALGILKLAQAKNNIRPFLIFIFTIIIIASWQPNFSNLQKRFITSQWKSISVALIEKKEQSINKPLFIVSEPKTRLHLSQYVSNEIITLDMLNINKYRNIDSCDIFFIYFSDKIITSMESQQYGDVKIIHYSNLDIESGLSQLRSDLIQTTIEYEVNPDFTDFYKNILDINKLLGYSENSSKYLELYLKSQQLTRRYLNMPVSQKLKLQK